MLAAALAAICIILFYTAFAAAEEIPATEADVIILGDPGDLIGGSVAIGDVNGDSALDLAFGAPGG
jgi:hypothetical protein